MGDRDWAERATEAVVATNVKVLGDIPSWTLAQAYLAAAQASAALMATQVQDHQRLGLASELTTLAGLGGLGGRGPAGSARPEADSAGLQATPGGERVAIGGSETDKAQGGQDRLVLMLLEKVLRERRPEGAPVVT